ncbi:MAG: hypothetical protein M9924_03325 [Rhizobiaceae bacterium]|nr:hypothetical protein [Rhizobiaceae bacterium]
MFRLAVTALLGYVAYRIAREITDSAPLETVRQRPARPKAAARPAAKRARKPATKPAAATATGGG